MWSERKEWVKNVSDVSNISDFKGKNPINKDLEHRRRKRFGDSYKFGIRNAKFKIPGGYLHGDTCQAICFKVNVELEEGSRTRITDVIVISLYVIFKIIWEKCSKERDSLKD